MQCGFHVLPVHLNASSRHAGLSVLCGGTSADKVSAAFKMFDIDNDGHISLDEMVQYLTSVFRVLYKTMPDQVENVDVEPEVLARATAKQCFAEADANEDGQLSFQEFQEWYMNPKTEYGMRLATQEFQVTKMPMEDVRTLLAETGISVQTMYEMFAQYATDDQGYVSRNLYDNTITKIVSMTDTPPHEQISLRATLLSLYDVFDFDENGVVDYVELCTGLTGFAYLRLPHAAQITLYYSKYSLIIGLTRLKYYV